MLVKFLKLVLPQIFLVFANQKFFLCLQYLRVLIIWCLFICRWQLITDARHHARQCC
jgi:hypothetical protein